MTRQAILATIWTLGLAVVLPTHAADRLLAHYELDLKEGNDLKRVQAAPYVMPGKPIEYDLSTYKVSLAIDLGPADSYVLTVSLASRDAPGRVLIERQFNGRLAASNAGPLEFRVEQGALSVSGALELSRVPE